LKHTWVAICFKALHHYRCSKGNIQPSLSVEEGTLEWQQCLL
jgi:hypothetical protein